MKIRNIVFIRKLVYMFRNYMNSRSFQTGNGNSIINRGGVKVNSRIQIKGDRNRLIIEKGCVIENALIHIQGNDNSIVLGKKSFISGAELWIEDDNNSINIGERTFVGHHSHIACTEGCSLQIDERCMISSYVQIRTGDSHSIFNNNGDRINKGMNIILGSHCWVGEGAKILKGVILEGDDIVSTGAIVTKTFQKNVLIGGVPAKIIKEEVNWDELR